MSFPKPNEGKELKKERDIEKYNMFRMRIEKNIREAMSEGNESCLCPTAYCPYSMEKEVLEELKALGYAVGRCKDDYRLSLIVWGKDIDRICES